MNAIAKAVVVSVSLALPLLGAAQTVAKSWAYKPFSVTSTKQKREVGDAAIADQLMCKSTLDNLAEFMDLVQNFDLVRTSATDGSMSMTTFLGRQEGRQVEVMFAVEARTRLLSHIWVDGKPHLHCKF